MTSHPTAQARGRGLGGPRRPRASVEWRGPQLPMGPRPTHGGRKRFGCLETVIFLSLQFFSYTAKA